MKSKSLKQTISIFVLVVLFCSIICLSFFAVKQENIVNAYVNEDTSLQQYQFYDYTARTAWKNIPRFDNYGYSFTFDINTGFFPFRELYINACGTQLCIFLEYSNGEIHLTSSDFGFDITYNTFYPFRLEIITGPVYKNNFRVHFLINTEYINYYSYTGSSYVSWDIFFTDGNLYGEPMLYTDWSTPSSAVFSVFYKTIPSHSIDVFKRSWVDNGAGYDSGYIDGVNSVNTSIISIFPAFIGSILGFFLTIASYEVLGISLLSIMIFIGSILLLLALLRIFLK